ncbi:CPBP family intramembrane metalloprotease [Aquibacillus koreensis]|uniref:CPBP family intramembrane metalloprotease n=1 Tax=Aquibacillus koreensis TaxID=279446 RepID=A0A9X4AGK5_9BACI|nr:CPBP family intramembrane glutamic endopeptidase [Aquibacillus koreensis]MCT2537333.1 CPBP family intramembrane metalloprotease [Aquibacillus koreensis]MDC3418779.1 CPBP family intramembrane metalloprotease [Aquibacillus koreensis]
MKDSLFIIISSLFACALLYILTQQVEVNYLWQTLFKVFVFLLVPLFYYLKVRSLPIKKVFNFSIHPPSKIAWIFALTTFSIILIAYFTLGRFVDFNAIANEMTSKSNITPSNFIFVGLYITFGNSFLEEWFFRGFIFKNLLNFKYKRTAYVFSSILFAVYHISIFQTWFNPWLILLCLIALFSVGLIFNWLNTKNAGFINSWLVHIFADAAIIIVGLIMFNMI